MELGEALAKALRMGLGTTLLATANGGRAVAGAQSMHGPGDALPAEPLIDFTVGLADAILVGLQRALASASPALRMMSSWLASAGRTLEPAVGQWVTQLQKRGRERRLQAEVEAAQSAEAMLPVVTDLLLRTIDIKELIGKIELQDVVEATIAQIDLGDMLDLMDVDAAVAATMSRIDLTELALQHMDMRRVVEAAMRDVDVVSLMRAQVEAVDIGELIRTTPTNIAGEALRQTSRLMRRG